MEFNHYGESLDSSLDFLLSQKDYEQSIDYNNIKLLENELSLVTENDPSLSNYNSTSEVLWEISSENYHTLKESTIFDILKTKLPI